MYFCLFTAWFYFLITNCRTYSTVIEDDSCDLYPNCMGENPVISVINSTLMKCTKTSSCLISSNNSSCAALQSEQYLHLGLKDVKVKKETENLKIQVELNSLLSLDFYKLGPQTSFLVKISFEETCYEFEFLLPFFLFKHFKGDILLPCFQLPFPHRPYLRLYFSTHLKDSVQNTEDIILIQLADYVLPENNYQKNVTEVTRLDWNIFSTTYTLDEEYFRLSISAAENSKCFFNLTISVIESFQDNLCEIQKIPVIRWDSVLKEPHLDLNCSKSLLRNCQKYCIYALFTRVGHCETITSESFIAIAFFHFMPDDHTKLITEAPRHFCENWNATVKVDTSSERGNIFVIFRIWEKYVNCFDFYELILFKCTTHKFDLKWGFQISLFGIAPYYDEEVNRVFQNVAPGYYSVLLVPFSKGEVYSEWTRNYEVFEVTEDGYGENGRKSYPEFPVEVLLAMGFLLFIATLGIWSYTKYKSRSTQKDGKEFRNHKDLKESIPLFSQTVQEVYIFHSHDDASVQAEVALLKDFLKECALHTVYTLGDVMDLIRKQPNRWPLHILGSNCSGTGEHCASNKKFIIVISEKTLHDLGCKKPLWHSVEEKAFQMALDFASADWRSAYCHSFVVCFNESLCHDARFDVVVPRQIQGVCYVLPDNLINLCMNLGPSPKKQLHKEDLLRCLQNHGIRNLVS